MIILCSFSNRNAAINHFAVQFSDSNWTFKPNYVTPQHGNPAAITVTDYRIRYTGHEIDVYLPYYGRAYGGADVFSGNNPLRFTTNDFTTERRQLKKGRTEILIRFNKSNDVDQMRFTIYPGGIAYLYVTMISRSSISFKGNLDM